MVVQATLGDTLLLLLLLKVTAAGVLLHARIEFIKLKGRHMVLKYGITGCQVKNDQVQASCDK